MEERTDLAGLETVQDALSILDDTVMLMLNNTVMQDAALCQHNSVT